MIYVDTSVVLAQLLSEDVLPPAALWDEPLVSSRLVEYETWTRVNKEAQDELTETTRQLLGRISFLELWPTTLERATEPWPVPVRTLDALHLASATFLRDRRIDLTLATYDERMRRAADALGVELFDLER